MTWLAEHGIVFLLLGAYAGMLGLHAWQGRWATHGVADYYVGGRTIGGVAIGLSFFATYASTNTFVGFAGQSYHYGAPWLLAMPLIVLFCLAAWTLVAPRLRRFTEALGSLTIADFIGFRFGSTPARVLAAAIVIVASFFYLTAVFKGAGTILSAFLRVDYGVAVWAFFFIVVTYTAVGGFVSVVRTDVVQGTLMLVAAVLLFRGTAAAAGGPGALTAVRQAADTQHLFTWDAAMPFAVLIGILVAAAIKLVVEPRQLSRFYALRDERAVRQGLWVATLAFLFIYTLVLPVGLFAHRILGGGVADSDAIVPALLMDPAIFHPAVSAFVILTLVAAAMSSIDSVLLVMAATFHRDLVALVRPASSERGALRATAAYVAVFALVTTLIALDPPGSIIALTAFSGSLYAACFFPALILGLVWRRGGPRAALASMIAGLTVLLVWKPLASTAVHELFPAMAASLLAYALAARGTEPPPSVRPLFAAAAPAAAGATAAPKKLYARPARNASL